MAHRVYVIDPHVKYPEIAKLPEWHGNLLYVIASQIQNLKWGELSNFLQKEERAWEGCSSRMQEENLSNLGQNFQRVVGHGKCSEARERTNLSR